LQRRNITESTFLLTTKNKSVSEKEDTLLLQKQLESRGVPSVSCSKLLSEKGNENINQGQIYVRYTIEEPQFFISLHNKNYDKVRYKIMKNGFFYERALSDCFREVLSRSSKNGGSRVLNVGGNIGWYSLLSAAFGAQVATFEPFQPNYLRMCESQCLHNWLLPSESANTAEACLSGSAKSPLIPSNIHIFPYGVSDKEKDVYFLSNPYNPGQSQITEFKTNMTTSIHCVSLDQMVEALGWTTGNIDILKVDVEGAEMGVFIGAQNLLKSQRVQNIFMEGNVRYKSEEAEFQYLISLFLDAGYYLYMNGGFSGPQTTIDIPRRDGNFSKNLVKECRKHPARQCNLWWVSKEVFFQKRTTVA
jgi:FkbM family methyltransferase